MVQIHIQRDIWPVSTKKSAPTVVFVSPTKSKLDLVVVEVTIGDFKLMVLLLIL